MRNQKKLLIDQLDRKLNNYKNLVKINPPDLGWINSIRLALNMTLEQLGNRLGIRQQGAKKIEERESTGAITINSLKEAGNALDMDFVYGFVPRHGSIESLIDESARKLAKKIVLRTNHNIKLEKQENKIEIIEEAIEEYAAEIKRKMPKSIWD